MSTRMRSPLAGLFSPRLAIALVKIALIGTWNGRTFLDDDADLSDIAGFAPVEPLPAAPPGRSEDTSPAAHSVAA